MACTHGHPHVGVRRPTPSVLATVDSVHDAVLRAHRVRDTALVATLTSGPEARYPLHLFDVHNEFAPATVWPPAPLPAPCLSRDTLWRAYPIPPYVPLARMGPYAIFAFHQVQGRWRVLLVTVPPTPGAPLPCCAASRGAAPDGQASPRSNL
jgi:hypothetical protein